MRVIIKAIERDFVFMNNFKDALKNNKMELFHKIFINFINYFSCYFIKKFNDKIFYQNLH